MTCSTVTLSYRMNFDLSKIVEIQERHKRNEKQEYCIYTGRSSRVRFFQHFPNDGWILHCRSVGRSRKPRRFDRLQKLLKKEIVDE